jgi:hypothetical protein
MIITNKASNSICLAFTIISFLFNACTEDTPDPGNIEYALKNSSEIDVGFKVRLAQEPKATIVKDSIIIKPGEEFAVKILRKHQASTSDSITRTSPTTFFLF